MEYVNGAGRMAVLVIATLMGAQAMDGSAHKRIEEAKIDAGLRVRFGLNRDLQRDMDSMMLKGRTPIPQDGGGEAKRLGIDVYRCSPDYEEACRQRREMREKGIPRRPRAGPPLPAEGTPQLAPAIPGLGKGIEYTPTANLMYGAIAGTLRDDGSLGRRAGDPEHQAQVLGRATRAQRNMRMAQQVSERWGRTNPEPTVTVILRVLGSIRITPMDREIYEQIFGRTAITEGQRIAIALALYEQAELAGRATRVSGPNGIGMIIETALAQLGDNPNSHLICERARMLAEQLRTPDVGHRIAQGDVYQRYDAATETARQEITQAYMEHGYDPNTPDGHQAHHIRLAIGMTLEALEEDIRNVAEMARTVEQAQRMAEGLVREAVTRKAAQDTIRLAAVIATYGLFEHNPPLRQVAADAAAKVGRMLQESEYAGVVCKVLDVARTSGRACTSGEITSITKEILDLTETEAPRVPAKATVEQPHSTELQMQNHVYKTLGLLVRTGQADGEPSTAFCAAELLATFDEWSRPIVTAAQLAAQRPRQAVGSDRHEIATILLLAKYAAERMPVGRSTWGALLRYEPHYPVSESGEWAFIAAVIGEIRAEGKLVDNPARAELAIARRLEGIEGQRAITRKLARQAGDLVALIQQAVTTDDRTDTEARIPGGRDVWAALRGALREANERAAGMKPADKPDAEPTELQKEAYITLVQEDARAVALASETPAGARQRMGRTIDRREKAGLGWKTAQTAETIKAIQALWASVERIAEQTGNLGVAPETFARTFTQVMRDAEGVERREPTATDTTQHSETIRQKLKESGGKL